MLDKLPNNIAYKLMHWLSLQDMGHIALTGKQGSAWMKTYPFWKERLKRDLDHTLTSNEEAKEFYRTFQQDIKNIQDRFKLSSDDIKKGLSMPNACLYDGKYNDNEISLSFLAMASSVGANAVLDLCLIKYSTLVDSWADPHHCPYDSLIGQTALHYAIFYGQPESVKLLIDRGANVSQYCNSDFAPELYVYTPVTLSSWRLPVHSLTQK